MGALAEITVGAVRCQEHCFDWVVVESITVIEFIWEMFLKAGDLPLHAVDGKGVRMAMIYTLMLTGVRVRCSGPVTWSGRSLVLAGKCFLFWCWLNEQSLSEKLSSNAVRLGTCVYQTFHGIFFLKRKVSEVTKSRLTLKMQADRHLQRDCLTDGTHAPRSDRHLCRLKSGDRDIDQRIVSIALFLQ